MSGRLKCAYTLCEEVRRVHATSHPRTMHARTRTKTNPRTHARTRTKTNPRTHALAQTRTHSSTHELAKSEYLESCTNTNLSTHTHTHTHTGGHHCDLMEGESIVDARRFERVDLKRSPFAYESLRIAGRTELSVISSAPLHTSSSPFSPAAPALALFRARVLAAVSSLSLPLPSPPSSCSVRAARACKLVCVRVRFIYTFVLFCVRAPTEGYGHALYSCSQGAGEAPEGSGRFELNVLVRLPMKVLNPGTNVDMANVCCSQFVSVMILRRRVWARMRVRMSEIEVNRIWDICSAEKYANIPPNAGRTIESSGHTSAQVCACERA